MLINVKTNITDYAGGDMLLDPRDPESKTLVLGNMIVTALNNPVESEKNLSAERKIHRAMLSQEVYNSMKASEDGFVDIPQEDIVQIKELMNHWYSPLPLMRAFEIFDPKIEKVKKKA